MILKGRLTLLEPAKVNGVDSAVLKFQFAREGGCINAALQITASAAAAAGLVKGKLYPITIGPALTE